MLEVVGNQSLISTDYVTGMLRHFAPADRKLNLHSIAEREISHEISELTKRGPKVSSEQIFMAILTKALDGSCFK